MISRLQPIWLCLTLHLSVTIDGAGFTDADLIEVGGITFEYDISGVPPTNGNVVVDVPVAIQPLILLPRLPMPLQPRVSWVSQQLSMDRMC